MESVVLPYALYIFMGLIFFYFALMCVNCIKHKGAVILFFCFNTQHFTVSEDCYSYMIASCL